MRAGCVSLREGGGGINNFVALPIAGRAGEGSCPPALPSPKIFAPAFGARAKGRRAMSNKSGRELLKGLSIGVLYGGPSSEREVSIESGENVSKALSAAGHDVHRVLLDGSFTAKDAQALGIDIAFLALHGEFGEDGRIQSILEEADIPYTGSGVDASSQAFDKMLAKRAFERCNVRTPAWMCLDVADLEKTGGAVGLY